MLAGLSCRSENLNRGNHSQCPILQQSRIRVRYLREAARCGFGTQQLPEPHSVPQEGANTYLNLPL